MMRCNKHPVKLPARTPKAIGETYQSVDRLGAPIRDRLGKLTAGISNSLPRNCICPGKLENLKSLLIECARGLSQRLGCQEEVLVKETP